MNKIKFKVTKWIEAKRFEVGTMMLNKYFEIICTILIWNADRQGVTIDEMLDKKLEDTSKYKNGYSPKEAYLNTKFYKG